MGSEPLESPDLSATKAHKLNLPGEQLVLFISHHIHPDRKTKVTSLFAFVGLKPFRLNRAIAGL